MFQLFPKNTPVHLSGASAPRGSAVSCISGLAFGAAVLALGASSNAMAAGSLKEALSQSQGYADLRLRYESVEQDNALKDAEAITLRSRLGLKTGEFSGFSITAELEDSSPITDNYNDANGSGAGYSAIADPESTEWDQFFLAYKGKGFSAKLGRQVIAYDNQRFIGHVGWRQDRQTFDALSVEAKLSDKTQLKAAYIDKRERIFAGDKDIEAKDLLLNLSQVTAVGKLVAYAYRLQDREVTQLEHNTYGLSLNGKRALDSERWGEGTVLDYSLEYAQQLVRSAGVKNEADYYQLAVGLKQGGMHYGIRHEQLGSDDGSYGFSTPLATGHKFNGWSDQFLATPAQGLVDTSASFATPLLGGKLKLAYHDFSAADAAPGIDDLGEELELLYTRKLTQQLSAGVKFAQYSAGDAAAGKVDTDKLWFWFSLKI